MLIREVVQEFGVTRQAVALAIRNNALPARKWGSQWIVQRADVTTYFAETGARPGRPKGRKDAAKRTRRKNTEETL